MVLGQRSAVDRAVDTAFVRTGTVHFLSVSGVHVGFLALMAWWAVRRLGVGMRAGAAVVAGVVVLYACLAQPRPPVLRATVLALLACWAVARHRPVITGNWLALSATLLLLVRPTDLFDVGFQLSFVVLIGVIYGSRALIWEYHLITKSDRALVETPRVHRLRQVFWCWARSRAGLLLSVALAAWLMGLPLVAHHFGRVSPFGWLNTILITPLVFVVMACSFAKLVWTALWPSLAFIPGALLGKASAGLLAVVEGLSSVPGASVGVSAMPWWAVGLAYTVLLAWVFRSLRPELLTRMRLVAASVLVGVVVVLSVVPWGRSDDALQIWLLDVGHGTSAYVEFPDGSNLVYDLGTLDGYDVSAFAMVPLLSQRRAGRVDRLIISHPNLDHYSGVPSLLDERRVGEALISEHFRPLSADWQPARVLLEHLEQRGVAVEEVSADWRSAIGQDSQLEVLWPPSVHGLSELSPNDSSVVLRVRSCGRSVLFCGDLEEEGIAGLLAGGTERLKADVLMLPHHAAMAEGFGELVSAVSPRIAASSNGRLSDNRRAALRQQLGDVPWLDTDRCGAIHVRLAADGVTAEGFINSRAGDQSGSR
jgi:competence protein ComEC